MARKLSFVLALAAMVAMALLLNLGSAPQIGVAGVAPDKPHDPSDEVLGGVINTNEDVKVAVPLSANHNDGTIGCEELDFSTSFATNGTVGAITDRACNTTVLARDLTDSNEFYDPAASEDGAGADSCSDGIDNDTADVPDGLADADDPECLVSGSVPVESIGGLDKVQGVIQIGDELISFAHAHPSGHSECGGVDSDKDSSPPCLHVTSRGAFKTTEATHSTGDTVVFRSEFGDAKIEDNISAGITDLSPEKGEALVLNSTAGFPSQGVVLVDDELIIYRGAGVTDIIRGALGTTAATHSSKAKVFLVEPGFYGTLVEEIDSVQAILRISTLAGYGLNGGIVEVENEVILYDQTGSTSAECGGAAPCLLGLTRSAFGTTSKLHETGTPVFTAAGDDIDQATANFTPRNEFFGRLDTVLSEDIDADDTIIPVLAAENPIDENFDSSGILKLFLTGEIVTYTGIGKTDAACSPFAPPCFTGVTRGRANTTAAAYVTGGDDPLVDQIDFEEDIDAGAGFLYTVGKDGLDSGEVLVLIRVDEVNDAPEFKAGSKLGVSLTQGTIDSGLKETNPQTSILIAANDIDNCDLTFTITSIPSSGTLFKTDSGNKVALAEDDVFTIECGGDADGMVGVENPPYSDKDPNTFTVKLNYVQDSTFDGSDSFTIEVSDNEDICPTASGLQILGTEPPPRPCSKNEKGTDTLTVNITNSRPTAGPIDKVEVPTDGERTILLTASDADLGHCELNFIVKTHPTHGNLVLQNNNECRPGSPNTDSATMVYRPDTGYSGPDSFTYQVFDRTGKGLYDAVLGDGHNRTSLEVLINVAPIVPPLKDLVFGDVDCDGDVDGVDALKIQRWIIGLSVIQEPGCLEIGSDY